MRQLKYFCDHCGKEIPDEYSLLGIEFGVNDYFKADLCPECINEVDYLIKEFVTTADNKEE